MPEKTGEKLTVQGVALELFKRRAAQLGSSPRQSAISCFRDARAFLAVSEELTEGSLAESDDESNPLDAAFAPNLKKTHPINLMSRTFGDISKVQAALSDLETTPHVEFYEPYGWGKPEINQARILFPAVVERSRQLAETR